MSFNRSSNRGPRYQVRRNNFVFHIFDTVQYRAVSSRQTQKQAEVEVAKRNAQ